MSDLIETTGGTSEGVTVGTSNITTDAGVAATGGEPPRAAVLGTGETTGTAASRLVTSREVLRGEPASGRKAANVWRRMAQQFSSAIDALDCAIAAQDDLVARTNAIEEAGEHLDALWQLRNSQTEEFAELVAMLCGLFREREAESMKLRELSCIQHVLSQLARDPSPDEGRANELTALMIKRGVDVYRGLR